MDTDGFGVAVILGLLALLAPLLWIGWWLLADLGESARATYPTRHPGSAGIRVTDGKEQTTNVGKPLATA